MPRFYTSPRPSGPGPEPSDSGRESSISVSSTGAIRETRPDGRERWSADTVEGAEEINREIWGPQTETEFRS